MKKIYRFACLLVILCLPIRLYADCGTPQNLQTSVWGYNVTFSWSGTEGSNVHAFIVTDKNTGNVRAYTSVPSEWMVKDLPDGQYNWKIVSVCNMSADGSIFDQSAWIEGGDFVVPDGTVRPHLLPMPEPTSYKYRELLPLCLPRLQAWVQAYGRL